MRISIIHVGVNGLEIFILRLSMEAAVELYDPFQWSGHVNETTRQRQLSLWSLFGH